MLTNVETGRRSASWVAVRCEQLLSMTGAELPLRSVLVRRTRGVVRRGLVCRYFVGGQLRRSDESLHDLRDGCRCFLLYRPLIPCSPRPLAAILAS